MQRIGTKTPLIKFNYNTLNLPTQIPKRDTVVTFGRDSSPTPIEYSNRTTYTVNDCSGNVEPQRFTPTFPQNFDIVLFI